MKVYTLSPHEDWIVDRFVNEWCQFNEPIIAKSPNDADVIWLIADWCWNQVNPTLMQHKKVVATVHHITPQKFDSKAINDFSARDVYVDVYTVPNVHTQNFITKFTSKRVVLIPYWANQFIWKKTDTKENLRAKYKIPHDAFVIGSFQRDTEGFDLKSPKLEKGPDIFVQYVEDMQKLKKKIHVLLAGWRRQHVISQLKKLNVNYTYIELPTQNVINELYQTLDLYPVTSRYEGGPQALIECGLLNVPVVSRDVGMASQLLTMNHSINDDLRLAHHEVPVIPNEMLLPNGFKPYVKLFEELHSV